MHCLVPFQQSDLAFDREKVLVIEEDLHGPCLRIIRIGGTPDELEKTGSSKASESGSMFLMWDFTHMRPHKISYGPRSRVNLW